MSIDIDIADPHWRRLRDLETALRTAVRRTLTAAKAKGSLTLRLTDDETVRALNARFRRKNKPTNVLSFPAAPETDGYLGDIAIAYGVTASEAKAARKPIRDHAVHLAVHGTLHLLGYDHINEAEADAMEAREIAILARLGIRNPYRQQA